MNILVLGGNGYLGSKITRKLIDDGHSVVCTKRKTSDISRLLDINDDISWISDQLSEIESFLGSFSIDYVLNMACNYGTNKSNNLDVLEANVFFPLKILDLSVEKGVNNFITVGTGLPNDFNMYSFTKNVLDDFGRYYVREKGINYTSVLLEMFYGYDEPVNRFLPSIIRNLILGESVETTMGTQRRDIICADDVIKAIMIILGSDIDGFNQIEVGTGEAPTISDIIDYLWGLTGKKSEVKKGKIPMRHNEPDCIADISVISKLGEWNPVHWKTGLKEMVKKIEEGMV